MSAIFPARYPGRCPVCDKAIRVDENVTYTEDDELVHARCEDVVDADQVDLTKVCPGCWTVHAGECA